MCISLSWTPYSSVIASSRVTSASWTCYQSLHSWSKPEPTSHWLLKNRKFSHFSNILKWSPNRVSSNSCVVPFLLTNNNCNSYWKDRWLQRKRSSIIMWTLNAKQHSSRNWERHTFWFPTTWWYLFRSYLRWFKKSLSKSVPAIQSHGRCWWSSGKQHFILFLSLNRPHWLITTLLQLSLRSALRLRVFLLQFHELCLHLSLFWIDDCLRAILSRHLLLFECILSRFCAFDSKHWRICQEKARTINARTQWIGQCIQHGNLWRCRFPRWNYRVSCGFFKIISFMFSYLHKKTSFLATTLAWKKFSAELCFQTWPVVQFSVRFPCNKSNR